MLMASGGVAMALASEVRDKKQEWGWVGLYRSLKRPSKQFYVGLFSHLPQLVISLMLATRWWKSYASNDNKRNSR